MSTESLHSSAVELLNGWDAPDPEQDSIRHTVLAFLHSAPQGCLRANVPGHITASALVVDSDARNVLLTLHPRVGKWLQLGGHCEPGDATIADAATREVQEESGIASLTVTGSLIQIHTHPVTCSLGVPTRHIDLRFVAITDDRRPAVTRSDESDDLAWWPINALPDNTDTASIAPLITYAQAALNT